jgi:hypothetical protein
MKIAIITLLQVAYAMLTQEAADAQGRRDAVEASRLLTAQAALHGVITALTAVNDAEVDAAAGRVAQRLEERKKK